MNPIAPPKLHGPSLGNALFKSCPDDFQVEEVLGWNPSGSGEHCFLWIEKTDWNTNDVSREIADRLQIRKRLISHSGLKDKNAITRQWFSIHLPGKLSPLASDIEADGLRVLRVTRNSKKLRRGTHRGNRFTIRLRDCDFANEQMEPRWNKIVSRGVPNYFGPQRFGRGGRNIDQALRMVLGEIQVHDRLVRGILISALRSFLFNACVAQRVLDQTWDQPLSGEIFGFPDNRSIILPNQGENDEPQKEWKRFRDGELELTAPLWGAGEPLTQDTVGRLEKAVVGRYPEIVRALKSISAQYQRRVIRLKPTASWLTWEDATTLVLSFQLPKGTYATAVLREVIHI